MKNLENEKMEKEIVAEGLKEIDEVFETAEVTEEIIPETAEDKILRLEKRIMELEEIVAAKTAKVTKPRKSRDVTEADVIKIVEGKKKGLSVKELMTVIDLTYGQIYSVYFGYTFTSISKIGR